MWFHISLLFIFTISFGFCRSSKLVQIACTRNPELSFCEESINAKPSPPSSSSSSKGNESVEVESVLNLPTFEEHLSRNSPNETAEIKELAKRILKAKTTVSKTTTTASSPADDESDGEGEEEKVVTKKPKKPKVSKSSDAAETIPDDAILAEPVPNESEKEEDGDDDGLSGSLLRLPKPPPRKVSKGEATTTPSDASDLITPPPLPASKTPPKNSRVGFVNVYISQFCVDRRKEFLVKCRTANVSPKDLEFCKSYPLECQSDANGVVPLLAYCERFVQAYVQICAPQKKRDRQGRQFCKAYDQFCVPPPTPADFLESNQALTKCEDIQPQARKVCNPFPPPHDRLNYVRCTEFHKFCSKYVDWQ